MNRLSRYLRLSRVLIGLGGIMVMLIEVVIALVDVSSAQDEGASAIQIVQVWTPHLYAMMTIIGVTIALYIVTRAVD